MYQTCIKALLRQYWGVYIGALEKGNLDHDTDLRLLIDQEVALRGHT